MSKYGESMIFNYKPIGELVASKTLEVTNRIRQEYTNNSDNLGQFKQRLLQIGKIHTPKITGTKYRVKDNLIEFVISYEGSNGDFFEYWPTVQPEVDRPEGEVISGTIYMYADKSDDADEIKAQMEARLDQLKKWLDATLTEANVHNQNLSSLVDDEIKAVQQKKRADSSLEDLLNS